MASIKVKFRPSSVADHEGVIYYQIIHDRKVRQMTSMIRLFPSEWDEKRSVVDMRNAGTRYHLLLSVRERIHWDLERLKRIMHRLEMECGSYTVNDVVESYNRYADEGSLSNFMEHIIIRLKENGKIRTSETYTATLRSFHNFLLSRRAPFGVDGNPGDIMLDNINSECMEAYEGWLRGRGVAPNTVSFYTRILRAVYNRAVESGLINNCHPFRHVYTGVDKTIKRALPFPALKRIKTLDLSGCAALDFARDMFMLSFYLRGMSFIDMAFLRKSDLSHGFLTYRRRKTGQRLVIEWTAEMQQILNKYPLNTSDYLLPIIRRNGTNERYIYRNVSYNINRNLKKIGHMAGAMIPLTLYVARHSWASAARAKGIPLSVISEGMGHDSESTTQIYLSQLDTSAVDRANIIIIRSL